MMKRIIFLLLLSFSLPSHAFEKFVVKDIRLEGLQRISVGTVFNYLKIKIGDVIDNQLSALEIGRAHV